MKAARPAGAAAARRAPARRRWRRPHRAPSAQRAAPTCSCPATSSSPTTPRRCRRACAAATSRPARRSRSASPAGARSRPTTSRASSPSSSAPATGARAPRTGRCRRRSRAGDALALGPLAATVVRTSLGLRAWSSCASPATPTRSAPASPVTAGRCSTRTSPTPLALWDVWTRDRGAAGRLRAAVGRLRPRLAAARRDSPSAASASRP